MAKSNSSPTMTFLPANQTVAVKGGTILEVALGAGIELHHSCGGMGTCTTCRIWIESDTPLPERNELERERAVERDFAANERLACQVEAQPNWRVRIPTPQRT